MPRLPLVRSFGSRAEPLLLEIERALTAQDIAGLEEVRAPTSQQVVQKLRAVHHRQAQLLAQGKTAKEVAAICGCSEQRVATLKSDPSFAELIGYYQDQIMAAMLNDEARLRDKLVDLGELVVDEIRDRLEEPTNRRKVPVGELRKIAEFAMDRTVAPPKVAAPPTSAPSNITITFGTPVNRPAPTIDHEPDPAQPRLTQD